MWVHLLCAATGTSFQPGLVVSLKLEGPQFCCPFFIGFADHSQCLVSCLDNFCIGILQKVYQIECHLQAEAAPLMEGLNTDVSQLMQSSIGGAVHNSA